MLKQAAAALQSLLNIADAHKLTGEPGTDRYVKVEEARLVKSELERAPKVVCLCGSTKFKEEFVKANFDETMKGNVVLSVGWFSHADAEIYTPTDEEKAALDELHKRKIDMADEILVVNVDGYIGESTRSEIEYAQANSVPVRYLFMADPVCEKDGKWFFWDETWANEHGPFETEVECREKLDQYCAQL